MSDVYDLEAYRNAEREAWEEVEREHISDVSVRELEAAGLDAAGNPLPPTSWGRVDLGPALRGEVIVQPPAYLTRDDGVALLYPGRPHSFFGPSESLKTWCALLACKSVLDAGKTVLYIDFESDEVSLVGRCRIVGIPDEQLLPTGGFAYVRPTEQLRPPKSPGMETPAFKRLAMVAISVRPALIVLDGVTECYALHGWDPHVATDVANYQQMFLRGLIVEDAATLEIDHTSKMAGTGQLGSQHKRAGIDGASYEFKVQQSGGTGGESIAKILVSKDRHGMVRAHQDDDDEIATLHVNTSPGRMTMAQVFLKAPDKAAKRAQQDAKAQAIQDQVVERVRNHPGISENLMVTRGPLKVTGKTDEIRAAIAMAEANGRIENRGTGHSKYFIPGA